MHFLAVLPFGLSAFWAGVALVRLSGLVSRQRSIRRAGW